MDNKFVPRTHEEMLAAVRVFQERHRKTRERLNRKLDQSILREKIA